MSEAPRDRSSSSSPSDVEDASAAPDRSAYATGARAALPFAVGAFVVGVSFGVLTRSLGWGLVAPIVMSAIVFAGSAQFGAAAILGSGGGPLAAVLAGVLLNSRFLPMGVALAPALKGGPLRRALEGQANVDASWAIASREGGRFDREVLLGATLVQYPAWVGGTAVGVLTGDAVGSAEALGLDVVFPAFFAALLFEEARGRRPAAVALLGAVVALALVPVAPPGLPVLAASVAALLGLRRSRRR